MSCSSCHRRVSTIPESLEQSKNIKVLQINLNKSNSAMQELTIRLRKETDFICMITEPSVIRHRLSGIPKHYNSIPTVKENSPRAAIFTSPSIPIQEISNLSHRDLAVGLIKCVNKQICLLYTSPSPRDRQKSRMPSSA